MNLAVVGSRDFSNLAQVDDYISQLPGDTRIVSGGARGVDTRAVEAARARGLSYVVYPADWDRWGKSAGYRRNAEIVAEADALVAFWDGSSKGTMHSVNLAREKGIPVWVITAQAG